MLLWIMKWTIGPSTVCLGKVTDGDFAESGFGENVLYIG